MKKQGLFFLISVLCGMFLFAGPLFAQEKPFAGLKVTFFCGGNEKDSFANIVYKGAKAAEDELGCKTRYIWSNWDPELMVLQLTSAIEANPDVICMMGHPSSANLKPLFDKAVRKGIVITLLNVDHPDLRDSYGSSGCGYVGQLLYQSGVMLGKGCADKLKLSKDDQIVVFELSKTTSEARRVRSRGILDGLKDRGMNNVSAETLPDEVNAGQSDATSAFVASILKKYPDLKLIVIDHGGVLSQMPSILSSLGKAPGSILVAGFDLSPETAKGIKNGYISLVHDQQPFLQGYLSVQQGCLSKKYGFAGLFIDTGVGLIDQSNIEPVSSLAEKGIR